VRACRKIDGVWAESEVMDADLAQAMEAQGKARIEKQTWPRVTCGGVNSQTKRMERFALYGGLAAENNTQAVARDILVNGMEQAEAAHYPVIGTVYDEVITEVPEDFGSAAHLSKIICRLPRWCGDLPLSADGYEAKRYRKG
jgi:DNA polymerase